MSTEFRIATKAWWVTASDKNPDKRPYRWEWFFKSPDKQADGKHWGGPGWIESVVSFARIEEMCNGHIVVAYQAGEGIVGLAYLDSDGYQAVEGGEYDMFDLKPRPTVWFDAPVPYSAVRDVPNARDNIEFVKQHQGTVLEITARGFDMILRCVLDRNRNQAEDISHFMAHSTSQSGT